MRQLFYLALTSVLAATLNTGAADFGLVAGINSTSAESKVNGTSLGAKTGYQFGGIGLMNISNAFYFRGGFIYASKGFTATPGNIDYTLTYVDLPLTGMYKFSDYAGFVLGPKLSLNVAKSCSVDGCTLTGVTSPISLELGISFKFAPMFGAELLYEHGMGKIADNVENSKSVIANFAVYFE